jgi:hypothetical protein
MPTPIEQIEADAMKLWPSVNSTGEVEAAWDVEIARRIRQIDAGEVETAPWDTVMTGLRSKFS